MDNGTKKYVCYLCGEKFDTSIACTQHNKEVHTENKPYKCGTCDRTFKHKCSMRRHEISHTEIKPYHCEFCKRSFTRKENLKIHIEVKHKLDKNYKCNVCKEIFTTYERLENHTKKRHKGVYECNQCLSTFIHYMDLKQHMKVHTGEKRYICKTCLKTLQRNSALAEGSNFAVRKVPKKEIISQIESIIHRLPLEQADNIRRWITNILSKVKPPPPNITRQEGLALKTLTGTQTSSRFQPTKAT
ncbi:PREDICTED: zinc finger protein 708-like [Trachymyrmex septentrionalis]|uniref:zinc finger protein 708-like n=1 Tax=Trachymyrmex septentrionalis TaxID=34720 RepID=UPI00084F701C|nr:PREDICTED: zinc finger protein 708-like [Trachymyrmex septentrionalis]